MNGMLKKFTTKSFISEIMNDIHKMDIKDVETMFEGMKLFTHIVDNYMKERYGSCKRHSDLHEYCYIIGESLMARYREINKTLLEEINEDVF